jgi:murein DD-endopeptidase MepM/ murein hydrolase activator NlpD
MAKSFYTFIIVPNASSRLHKVRVPVQFVYVLAAIGLISFFVAVGLGFSYAKMAFRMADYQKLEAENMDLKIQKKNLEVTTLKLSSKISALEDLSEKLTHLIENDPFNKRNPKLSLPGVGGSKVNYTTADLMMPGDIKTGVELLKDRTLEVESQMRLLEQVAQKQSMIKRATPTIWPVQGRITSHYGTRRDPFNGDREMHLGLDIAGIYGTPVVAPADGVIIYAQRKSAYGNLVIVNHGDGVTTRHGHLSRFAVRVGQKVQKGEVIAFVGNTGRTTAPHLHYEVRLNDRPVNPRNYLR